MQYKVRRPFEKTEIQFCVVKMVLALTKLKQRITDPDILSLKSWLTVPIQAIFTFWGTKWFDRFKFVSRWSYTTREDIVWVSIPQKDISDIFNFCTNPTFRTNHQCLKS